MIRRLIAINANFIQLETTEINFVCFFFGASLAADKIINSTLL